MTADLPSELQGAPAPVLVIITGPTASGKTHLARRISQRHGLVLIDKDGIKETLFDSLGWSDRDWSKKLGSATYDLMYHMARRELSVGRSLILESNFRAMAESTLHEMQAEYGCRFLQVHCDATPEILLKRFCRRWQRGDRHPGHVDDLSMPEVRSAIYDGAHPPLDLDGQLIRVDTSDLSLVDVEAIMSAVAYALSAT